MRGGAGVGPCDIQRRRGCDGVGSCEAEGRNEAARGCCLKLLRGDIMAGERDSPCETTLRWKHYWARNHGVA